ncbi:MAG TPA: hypothetical protein VHS99_17720 [Chloroflexota bacterium]|nr:hypothetical protein [Chloroflexota bacterium]
MVIYLGMRVNVLAGLRTLFGIGDDIFAPTGMMNFAPLQPARGSMFSARRRLGLAGESSLSPAVSEEALETAGGA